MNCPRANFNNIVCEVRGSSLSVSRGRPRWIVPRASPCEARTNPLAHFQGHFRFRQRFLDRMSCSQNRQHLLHGILEHSETSFLTERPPPLTHSLTASVVLTHTHTSTYPSTHTPTHACPQSHPHSHSPTRTHPPTHTLTHSHTHIRAPSCLGARKEQLWAPPACCGDRVGATSNLGL